MVHVITRRAPVTPPTRIHDGDAEVCRAFLLIAVGTMAPLFMLAWAIGDQFNPACNGTGTAADGPHAGTECAQQNYGMMVFFTVFLTGITLYGLNVWLATIAVAPDGIDRRTLFLTKHIPWSDVTSIEATFVDTNHGGVQGALEQGLKIDKLWRVVAHTRTGTKHRALTLLNSRDEQTATAWARELDTWIRGHKRSQPE